jgi:hypothetical protein
MEKSHDITCPNCGREWSANLPGDALAFHFRDECPFYSPTPPAPVPGEESWPAELRSGTEDAPYEDARAAFAANPSIFVRRPPAEHGRQEEPAEQVAERQRRQRVRDAAAGESTAPKPPRPPLLDRLRDAVPERTKPKPRAANLVTGAKVLVRKVRGENGR